MIDEIIKIEKVELKSKRYDIEVCVNHNFYANNILVHNCQSEPELLNEFKGLHCYISTKYDGTSATFIWHDNEEHVCSRNLSLKEDDKNTHWQMYKKYNIRETLCNYCKTYGITGLSIQGEICGPGIQGNPLGLKEVDFFVFNIVNTETRVPFTFKGMIAFCNTYGLKHVRIEDDNFIFNHTIDELLELAEGTYDNGGIKEGIVIRPLEPKYSLTLSGSLSVKAINNKYLLKKKGS